MFFCVALRISSSLSFAHSHSARYKIGDSFISLPQSQALELLAASQDDIDRDVSALEQRLQRVRGEMKELKVALYARFGRSINLET